MASGALDAMMNNRVRLLRIAVWDCSNDCCWLGPTSLSNTDCQAHNRVPGINGALQSPDSGSSASLAAQGVSAHRSDAHTPQLGVQDTTWCTLPLYSLTATALSSGTSQAWLQATTQACAQSAMPQDSSLLSAMLQVIRRSASGIAQPLGQPQVLLMTGGVCCRADREDHHECEERLQ